MYNVVILVLAKKDIQDATDWYNFKQKGLGKRFTSEIRTRILLIRKHPKLSAIRYDEIRTAVLDKFPFMIHYQVEDSTKTIIVSAVFHTSLDPEKWKIRK